MADNLTDEQWSQRIAADAAVQDSQPLELGTCNYILIYAAFAVLVLSAGCSLLHAAGVL